MPACFSSYPTLPLSVKHYYCCIQSLYFLSGLLTCGNPYLKKTQTYYSIIIREQPYIFLNLQRTLVLEAKKDNVQAQETQRQSLGDASKTYIICLNAIKSTVKKAEG